MGSEGGKAIAVGIIDPSNLHLKKELIQIRKTAKGLMDPRTSSTWRSPLNSSRSLSKHHYVHHHKNGLFDPTAASSNQLSLPLQVIQTNVDKEGSVFLYNWRTQKSRSVDLESFSDAGNDSKSDAYLSEKYPSAIFRCKDANFTPSIRRSGIKKKLKRGISSSVGNDKLIKLGKCGKNGVTVDSSLGLGNDDLVDTEDYYNYEDLWTASAVSPLLTKFKNKGWPPKLLRNHRKEDDSVSHTTPALSTSSYNKHGVRNPSVAESWDATTGSFNDADDEVDDQLNFSGRQGCGIPCYWSRRSTPKSRAGYGSCCSPSLSDALRRKGSSIFFGGQSIRQRRFHRPSLGLNKRRRTAGQSLIPLLNHRGSSMGSGNSDDDEIGTNFGELDFEALNRLDGRRWSSSCRSLDGLELVAINAEAHGESSPENVRSLSHRYRPMFFEELIGQNIVVQSLVSAISRQRIVPVYLFQGPRGTGKTSMARIFAAALNCLSTEKTKPCGLCRECSRFVSSRATHVREIDGSSKKEIESIKSLLRSFRLPDPSSHSYYKVFVINECHLLPSKTWLTFLQLLEKPLPHVVFILVTTDIDKLPRSVLSRCQKHIFNKISNADIVARLSKIANNENLDAELDALELIASNADGAIRDAETMLDQLSLFGKRITISMVNELVGVVPEEKLLDLLELAMSSDATETVIRARELLELGVDPIVVMSQMATLIVDIIAGTYQNEDGKQSRFFGGRNLDESEVERLKHALTLLSEAEKHLRVSSERSTWFTATLLQLGSMPSPDLIQSRSSRALSSKMTDENHLITSQKQRIDTQLVPEILGSRSAQRNSTSKDNRISLAEAASSNPSLGQFTDGPVSQDGVTDLRCVNSKMLSNFWLQCIEKCHSKTLRQLLHVHGKLVSISEAKGSFIAYVAFEDKNIKTRAEGFLSSITNSFEFVLRHNVEVKIIQLPASLCQSLENKLPCSNVAVGESNLGFCQEPERLLWSSEAEKLDSVDGETNMRRFKNGTPMIPVKSTEAIVQEQRSETAWLQAMEKGTPASLNKPKPERNQVLPQDGLCASDGLELMLSAAAGTQHCKDELNHEIEALKISDAMMPRQDQIMKRTDHYHISPSKLHNRSANRNLNKDNLGYESGSGAPGCSGMLCWNHTRLQRRGGKAKQGKNNRFTLFGECAKLRKTNKSRQQMIEK